MQTVIFTAVVLVAVIELDHWLLHWPGTVLHESLHWLVGLVFNAQPSDFTVMPDDHSLGSVTFMNIHSLNALPTALAPMLILPTIYLAWPWLATLQGTPAVLAAWVLASSLIHSIPSRADIAVAEQHPKGSLAWIFLLGYIVGVTL